MSYDFGFGQDLEKRLTMGFVDGMNMTPTSPPNVGMPPPRKEMAEGFLLTWFLLSKASMKFMLQSQELHTPVPETGTYPNP